VSEPGNGQTTRVEGEAEAVLRAKYHDYCSAQVADTLLLLTPDEIFVMAEDAARDTGAQAALSYDRAVRLATATVSRRLALPPFEAWLADYQAHPDRYERYLMGLWKSDVAREGNA